MPADARWCHFLASPEQFTAIFEGLSIGSNDLTQLIRGVDRDSEIVAPIFDERNDAVKTTIAQVIRTCRERGRLSASALVHAPVSGAPSVGLTTLR